MTNTINTVTSGQETASQHLEIINQLCDDLLTTFSPSREQVTDYTDSVSISLSFQNFLLTDQTIRYINQIDKHLSQLYNIATEEKLITDHHEIRTTIQEKIDLIVQLLIHNNHLHMTYGRKINEIIQKLQQQKYQRLVAA